MQSTHHARRTLHRRRMADPFSRDSTLPDLSERATRLRAGSGYGWVLVPAMVIVTAVLLASPLFAVRQGLAALVIGAELVLAVLTVFIGVARNRTIAGIAATTGREGYQRILSASAHYRWVGSLYGLAISTGTAALALILYRDAVSYSLGGAAVVALPALGAITPGYLLLLLIAFRLFQTGSSGLRYRWARSLPETRDYAELNRRYLVIDRKEKLIRYVPIAGVVILGLFLWHGILGIPWEVALAGAGVLLLFMVFAILVAGRERMPRVKASRKEKAQPASPPQATAMLSLEVTRNSTPLPPPVVAVHPPGSATPVPVSTGTVAVIDRDPASPEGEDFEPWW
ncbi:MAG: hypothetical protein LUQ41_08300 [Methanomicrobiales archaeon]|nr:hypothetical protein [Methanomicrobiales archaeon]